MKLKFKQFFLTKWPPKTIPHYQWKISNKFTQYLEYLLQEYCKTNGLYLLSEIRVKNKDNRKMDYLICGKEELNAYFSNKKKTTEISAKVCLEAQWDKNKFTDDFVEQDFPKLGLFKSEIKVAIAGVPSTDFSEYAKQLNRRCRGDSKSNYLIWLFFYDKKRKEIIWQARYNFKKILDANKRILSV